jgi:hypothetical protein
MGDWFTRAKRTLLSRSLAATRICRADSPNPYRRSFQFEELEQRLTMAAAGLITTPQTYSGVLNDKIVFTSGGHGWRWSDTLGRYATDRGDNNELVEDFGNQEQMTAFADYALRAGATVVPMRPVGRQINEVVLDNDSAGVTFTGGALWSDSSSAQRYDEDYGASADAVAYRSAGTVTGAETATATYTPNIPQAGFYPVYAWVLRGTNRTEQTYRVNHTGGSTEITVDHSKVGSGWIYLGTYHFEQGTSATGEGSVVISNKAPVTGKVVIADAIRFGNGMGDWVDTTGAPGVSGYPREDENSFHWIARSVGVGTTLATATGASSDNNVSAPSNFAQYMFAGTFGEAVYVGFHSNAGGGRGARGLIDSSAPTPHQAGTNGLADILGDQINQDMQNLNGVFEYNWTTGTTSTFTGAFGEINLGASAEMDATIIEVAFHDDVMDAAIMRDPTGRDQIARSTLQGTVQYFSLYGSPLVTNTSLPTPPTNVRAASNASGAVTVNWVAGPSTPASVYGAAATGFKVYASVDGYGFDGGRVVAGGGTTSLTITGLDPNLTYFFKVAATNAGGESSGSEVVAALPSGGAKQVLIVGGFDRYDRTQNFRYPYLGQTVDRVWPRYNNSFDYVVQVASAIQASKPGVHVATTSNEAVISGAVNLTDYNTVIWISGTESTTDDTFNATEQTKVTAFLNAGGNLFTSGSELGWDLDQQNNGRTFYETTLRANYVSDDAGTYTATANAGSIFNGMSSFVFSNGSSFSQQDNQMYDVAFPDVIAPQAGATAALTYSGGTGGTAAIQSVGTGGAGNLVMFAFPFEAMTNETRRNNAMGHILAFLGGEVAIETRVNGQDADSPTGPTLAVGSSASLTYIVTNPGIVALSSVAVVDDNGTPASAADDFNATYSSGDTNSNNQLDVGETWTFTATRTVVAGQTTRTGKVTASGSSNVSVNASDAANYFGSAPGIAIETKIDGDEADSAPGPTLPAGGSRTFTYEVTNTGNSALSNVAVTDDNGTPGNAADDFNPALSSGDANGNNQLDLGETWTFSASRTVVAGAFSNSASVSAQDAAAQVVNASDPANYFGSAPGISVQSSVNGDDADSPTGPTLAVGSSVTVTYIVTNTGNVPLGSVQVWDDNGTPGDTGDDFQAEYQSGDDNFSEYLETNETWTLTVTRTVAAGQFSGAGRAIGFDPVFEEVQATDPTNYFGALAGNADFNGDTIVDSSDFVIWRKNNGITSGATHGQGDANGDGAVDQADYAVYRAQYGTSPGAGSGAATGVAMVSAPAVVVPAASNTSTTERKASASDAAVGMMFDGSEQRSEVRRTFVERAREVVAHLRADWNELLNDLAECRARHSGETNSTSSHSPSTKAARLVEAASQIDCLISKALVTIEGWHS